MAPEMKNTRKHCFFLLFVSTEQKADKAKEVLDKANFAQRQQRGSFRFRFLLPPHLCRIWCSPAKGKETNAPPRAASRF